MTQRAINAAATRLGIEPDVYLARQAADQKWCTACRLWHMREEFRSDASRGDGLSSRCRHGGKAPGARTPPNEPAPPRPVTTRIEPTVLAYLAGVIDSDGYVTSACSIYKGRRSVAASVGITGTNRAPHDLAAQTFGGNVNGYAVKGAQAERPTNYMWQRYGRRALPVLGALVPYLRVKQNQAYLALQLEEDLEEARFMRRSDDPYPWFGPNYDPAPRLISLAQEIRELNTRSTRSRLADGQVWDEYPGVSR